ncbi:diguanylate cyclase [Myxococcota bacterium]|nr:diguanylate cyclase [Myxococcota bacterium]
MRILLADDDPVSRSLFGGLLRKSGFEVVAAPRGDVALALALDKDAPRLLILDWVMPGLTGPEVIQRLREQDPDTFRYTILLTLRHRAADLVAGLQAGADDYVRKPCDPRELVARVQVGQRMLALQEHLATTNRALERLASIDALTELRNRRSVLGGLEELSQRCAAAALPLGVAMLDIDHFKQVNDTWGHPVGDLVLRTVARRLAHHVREPDLVGRYGGEEFLVALGGVEGETLEAVGQRLLRAVREEPITLPACTLSITTSVGMACRLPGQALTVPALLKLADDEVYRAKRTGRDRVCVAGEPALATGPIDRAA